MRGCERLNSFCHSPFNYCCQERFHAVSLTKHCDDRCAQVFGLLCSKKSNSVEEHFLGWKSCDRQMHCAVKVTLSWWGRTWYCPGDNTTHVLEQMSGAFCQESYAGNNITFWQMPYRNDFISAIWRKTGFHDKNKSESSTYLWHWVTWYVATAHRAELGVSLEGYGGHRAAWWVVGAAGFHPGPQAAGHRRPGVILTSGRGDPWPVTKPTWRAPQTVRHAVSAFLVLTVTSTAVIVHILLFAVWFCLDGILLRRRANRKSRHFV